jgi:hypothetical protein
MINTLKARAATSADFGMGDMDFNRMCSAPPIPGFVRIVITEPVR